MNNSLFKVQINELKGLLYKSENEAKNYKEIINVRENEYADLKLKYEEIEDYNKDKFNSMRSAINEIQLKNS